MRAGFGGGEYPFRDRLIVCVYGPARPAAGHPVRLACVAAQDQACLALALLRKASESCRESAFPGPTTAAGVCWALPVVGTAAAVSVAYAVIRPAAPSTWWPAPGGRFDRQRPELLRLLVATRRRPGRARRARWPRAGRWRACIAVDLVGQRPAAGSSASGPRCCAWWWPRAAGLAVRGRHAGPLRAAGGHAAPLMPVETRAVRSSLPVRSQRTAPRLADPELSICCPRTAARCTLQAGQPMAGAVGGRLLYGA